MTCADDVHTLGVVYVCRGDVAFGQREAQGNKRISGRTKTNGQTANGDDQSVITGLALAPGSTSTPGGAVENRTSERESTQARESEE